MAFDVRRWAHISESFNTGALTTSINPSATPVVVNAPGLFTYASASDTIATIAGANYFADQVDNLAVGDIIMAKGSDATGAYVVATVDRDAGTITLTDWEIAGTVDTANIVDGAVTTAKIANLAVTNAKIADSTILTGKLADGAVSSAKLAPTTIRYVRVSMSAAQWNGMYATPVLILAAQGPGTQIVIHEALFTMTYVSAQYAAGGAVRLQYNNTAAGAGTAAAATVAAATVNGLSASSTFRMNGQQVAAATTATQNLGIYISNDTAAFTTGDSTFVIDMWYSVSPA